MNSEKIELAVEIASKIMDEKYLGQPWMEEDENEVQVVQSEYEDEFNNLYDEAYAMLDNYEIKRNNYDNNNN